MLKIRIASARCANDGTPIRRDRPNERRADRPIRADNQFDSNPRLRFNLKLDVVGFDVDPRWRFGLKMDVVEQIEPEAQARVADDFVRPHHAALRLAFKPSPSK
jgi:hypothetical protein